MFVVNHLPRFRRSRARRERNPSQMKVPAVTGRSAVTVAASVFVACLGGILIAVLPGLVGVTWPAIGASLAAVPLWQLLGFLTLWLAGLLVHAPVLMAAMPGLSVRQSLTLNLGGSAVSNVLPFGGPAGM